MKLRYVIERYDDPPGSVVLALVNTQGEVIGTGSGLVYESEAKAKEVAEQSMGEDFTAWKPAPEAWQPDTYLVSNYYEDEGWDQ